MALSPFRATVGACVQQLHENAVQWLHRAHRDPLWLDRLLPLVHAPVRLKRQGQVLVVVSDDATRAKLAEALGLGGHLVEAAGTAADALASIEQSPPDLVVLDRPLAGPSFELLARIRKLSPGSALLELVADNAMGDIDEAVARGADHCLTTPVNVVALQALVRRALEKPLLTRQVAEARSRTSERLERGNFERIVGAQGRGRQQDAEDEQVPHERFRRPSPAALHFSASF